MAGYTPLFDTLTRGTLCGRWPDIGLWPIILSLSDKDGVVDVTPLYIAGITGLAENEVVACMTRFCDPDPYSRSQDAEGCRLQLLDAHRNWGWKIVNHGKYREKARLQAKNAKAVSEGREAERKRHSREKSAEVRRSPPVSDPSNANTNTGKRSSASKLAAPDWSAIEGLNLDAWDLWLAYRRKTKRRPYTTDMKAKELAVLTADEQLECVNHSISNEYSGLFPDKVKRNAANSAKPDTFDDIHKRNLRAAGFE